MMMIWVRVMPNDLNTDDDDDDDDDGYYYYYNKMMRVKW